MLISEQIPKDIQFKITGTEANKMVVYSVIKVYWVDL